MDENLKIIPRTFTPQQIWVAGKLELPPHIAASDFDDNWQASVASGHACVPMRMDFKQIGVVKTIAAGEGKIDLCWSSDDGRRLNRQSVILSRFKTQGQDHVCLGCPGCGRPRKELFLVAVRNNGRPDDGAKHFAFFCKKCSGIDSTRDRKSRRQNATRKNWKNGRSRSWRRTRPGP
jgi:hypothetical protein